MRCADFQKMLLKAKPGQHIRYHLGNLAAARQMFRQVHLIANYVLALESIGVARLYQKKHGSLTGYYIVLTERLKVRKDGQGSHQEAQRIMEII